MPSTARLRDDDDAAGLRGLAKRSRDPRHLTEAQMEALAEIVETGPDPARDGGIRWRRIDPDQATSSRSLRCFRKALQPALSSLAPSTLPRTIPGDPGSARHRSE